MSIVRAKFKCLSVTTAEAPAADAVHKTYRFVPAMGEENKTWSRWTPSGQLDITITNPDIGDAFVPGSYYYLDFSPAET